LKEKARAVRVVKSTKIKYSGHENFVRQTKSAQRTYMVKPLGNHQDGRGNTKMNPRSIDWTSTGFKWLRTVSYSGLWYTDVYSSHFTITGSG